MKRYFQISCHALIASAFLALALTGRLDMLSIALFIPALLASLYRTITSRPPLLTARGGFYLSCAYIVFFFFDASFLSASLISATVHMVLFLELAKLFQEKTDRDYFLLIVLAFLKILAASSLTIDLSFALALLVFLVALVSTLMSFDMYRAEQRARGKTGETTFTLGGMSVWASGWIVIVGAIFFFTIPRVGTGYFTRAAMSPLMLSGFSENVTLGQIGEVKLGTAIVMHATRLAGTPYAVLKWRGVALDTFDGTQWYKSDRSKRWIRGSGGGYPIRQTPVRGELVRYEVLLEPIDPPALLGPHPVRGISGRLPGGIEIDDDDSIYVRLGQSRRIQYQVVSEIPKTDTPADPLDSETLPAEKRAAYLQLPEDLDPRVTALARDITAGAGTNAEKASLVETYLKRNHQYTLLLDWNPGDQPVTTFLLEAKSGHCEYFASSMAILLRAAGVPTRLVNGFLMGEYNPVSDAYVVRQSDAHSWVEVYVPGNGWTEYDPTPPDTQEETGMLTSVGNYVDAARLFWNTYLLTYDSEAQMQLFRSAQEGVQTLQSEVQQGTERLALWTKNTTDALSSLLLRLTSPAWLVGAGLLAAMGAGVHRYRVPLRARWQLWRIRRGRTPTHGEMEEVVGFLFDRAVRIGGGAIPYRQAAQTWREWLGGVSDSKKRSILFQALQVFERSRYGRVSSSVEDLNELERAVRELRSLPG